MAKPRAQSLPDQLRAAIVATGLTNYAIAEASGVDEAQLSRFRRGSDIRLETAGRICAAIGVEPLRLGRGRARLAPKTTVASEACEPDPAPSPSI